MNDQRYFVKIKKNSNQVADFKTINRELLDSTEEVDAWVAKQIEDDDHFKWIEYDEVENNAEVENIFRLQWRVYIDGEDFGPLENMMIGSVIDDVRKSFLPRFNFGDSDPSLYKYDYVNHEWKAPLFEGGGTLVWDEASGDYVPLNV